MVLTFSGYQVYDASNVSLVNFQAIFGQYFSIRCIQNTSFCNLYLFNFPKMYRFPFAKLYGFGDMVEERKIAVDGKVFEIH